MAGPKHQMSDVQKDIVDEVSVCLQSSWDAEEKTLTVLGRKIYVHLIPQVNQDKMVFKTFVVKSKGNEEVELEVTRYAFGRGLINNFESCAAGNASISPIVATRIWELANPQTRDQATARREAIAAIREQHRMTLSEFTERYGEKFTEDVVDHISKNRGYGNKHWGTQAADVLCALDAGVAELDDKSYTHLCQLLDGEGIFSEEKKRKVGESLRYDTLVKAKGILSSSLGSLVHEITNHSSILRGYPPKVTYHLEIVRFCNDYLRNLSAIAQAAEMEKILEKEKELAERPATDEEALELATAMAEF